VYCYAVGVAQYFLMIGDNACEILEFDEDDADVNTIQADTAWK
jgi:hypothetical protein